MPTNADGFEIIEPAKADLNEDGFPIVERFRQSEQFAGATPGSPFQPLTAPYSEYQQRVVPTDFGLPESEESRLARINAEVERMNAQELRAIEAEHPSVTIPTEVPGTELPRTPIELPRFEADVRASTPAKIGVGLYNVGAGLVEFPLNPEGAALTAATAGAGMTGGTISRLAGTGWAVYGAKETPRLVQEAQKALETGTPQQKTEALATLGVNTLITVGGVKGALGRKVPAEIAPEERLAPQTAAAIREPIVPAEAPKAPETVSPLPEPLPTPETAPTAPPRPAVAIPEQVRDAAREWAKAEKRLRRALRQDPTDLDAARTARDDAEVTFRGLAEKRGISQDQFDTLRDFATRTETERPSAPIPEQPVAEVEIVPPGKQKPPVKKAPVTLYEQDVRLAELNTEELHLRDRLGELVKQSKAEWEKAYDEGKEAPPFSGAPEIAKIESRLEVIRREQGPLIESRNRERSEAATRAGREETPKPTQQFPALPAPPEPAIAFPGIGSLREKQATAMDLGKIRKAEPELWKEIVKLFGTDQPAKLSKLAKARLEQMKRPESSVGPGAASVDDPAFMPQPARLDFGNMARSALQSVVNAFRTKARQQLPELPSVSGEFLPDLGNRQQNKLIASEPTGVGRVPLLGWLLDPRQRARTPEEISILTWFHENAMGQAHVQALGSTFGTHFKRLFPRSEKGEFTTVGRTSSAQSMHPSDVFEGLQRDPKSYVLSPEQRAAFEELMTYEQKARELSKKYKLRFDEETGEFIEGSEGQQPYWTRGRVLKPGAEKRAVGGTMLGARQYFQKGRTFKTEQEGVEKGFEYPLNVDDRFLMRAGRLYKAIADRRLAKDPDLGGRWGGTPKYEESYVFQPAFQRRFAMETPEGPQAVTQYKIFPLHTANKLNRAFGPHGSIIRKWVVSANNFLKGLTLGFDWGVAQIQGLTTMYKNPGIWADAQVKALKAFVNRDVFSQYVRNNLEPVREYAQFGGSIGRLPEMMAGLERGEILTGTPRAAGRALERRGFERTGKAIAAIAEVPEAFGRQFQTFLDVAKIELWKARREAVPKSEWAREVQAIESQLQSGRMESIGVTPNQALVERMLLLAPSYYRGALNLIAGLGERGASGQTYRRAMGAYMLGTTATFVGLALAAGLSWDEIRRRLNPSRGDFLMVPVKTGNRTMNVGFGGINRSLMRLAGETAETSVEQPGNWKSLSPEKNPFVRWFRAHSAPIPATTWDAFSGRDYMGDETDIQSLGKRAVPLAIQELFAKERAPRTSAGVATEVAASLTGLTAFPGRAAKQEISSLHRDWLRSHPKESVREDFERHQNDRFGVSKYNEIYQAMIDRDGDALKTAMRKRLALGDKLSKIKEQINPKTKEGVTEQLFQSKKELEKQFVRTLSPEQRKLYDAALKERQEQYNWFRRYF